MKMRKTVIFLSMLTILSGCRTTSILSIENMPVPTMKDGSSVLKERVKQAILAGCSDRGWTARVVGEDMIEADIIVRTYRVKVRIPFSDSHYSILHEDSQGLRYNEQKGTIHRVYNRWVSFLDKSIQKAMRQIETD